MSCIKWASNAKIGALRRLIYARMCMIVDKNTANTNSGAGNGRRGRRSSKLDHVNELVAAKTLLTPLTPLTPFPQTPQTPQSQFSGATEDLRSPSQWSPLSLNSESVTWSTYGSLNFSE